jgi:heme-degrading monooxygenase HmoA
MYAVIFKGTVANFDDEYHRMAQRLYDLAFEKYGCRDFVSVIEGDQEIAISYWETEQQIREWKNDPEHSIAKERGRDKWYKSYSVEICKIVETR